MQEYTVIRQRRRTIALYINPNGTLTVKAPFLTPDFFIKQFIKQKQDWIDKHIARIKQYPQLEEKKFIDGELFLFLGTEYPLNIIHTQEIKLTTVLEFPFKNKRSIKKRIIDWYKQQALQTVMARVEKWARIMNVTYTSIDISNAKRRWGACSYIDELTFNWRLIMAPLEAIDYVVIHELAHITEKNHSKQFWELVQKYCPDYKIKRRWLKVHGNAMEVA
ncbi:MAG TPA: SprT family zinc-dependent metalloprotease [Candidatus Woesebacteria bacterium]|nr:SprT family zinc-dependent metalloprotease [Candidatus Woesebacteria bacterium]